MTRHRPAPAPRRRLLGTNPSLVVFTGLAIAAAFVFAWGWVSAPPDELADVLNVGSALALCVVVMYVLGTIRVVGDGEGYVEIVNILVVRRVPVEEIERVVVTDGLRLVLTSGREIGFSAYGQSLAGRMAGYPRSVRAAQRIEAFLRSLPDTSRRTQGERVVETRARLGAVLLGAGLGLVLLVSTVAINAVRNG
jgi:hypothetical protein